MVENMITIRKCIQNGICNGFNVHVLTVVLAMNTDLLCVCIANVMNN